MTRRKAPPFPRGSMCRACAGADFAQANQIVTVLEVLPNDRVRIKYGDVTDLTVSVRWLEPFTAAARVTDPVTSRRAAQAQTHAKLTAGQRVVLDALALVADAGLTDFELAEQTGRKQTSIGVRRGELTKAGLVEATSAVRPSDTGSDALVWRLTVDGVAVWSDLTRAERGAA